MTVRKRSEDTPWRREESSRGGTQDHLDRHHRVDRPEAGTPLPQRMRIPEVWHVWPALGLILVFPLQYIMMQLVC